MVYALVNTLLISSSSSSSSSSFSRGRRRRVGVGEGSGEDVVDGVVRHVVHLGVDLIVVVAAGPDKITKWKTLKVCMVISK